MMITSRPQHATRIRCAVMVALTFLSAFTKPANSGEQNQSADKMRPKLASHLLCLVEKGFVHITAVPEDGFVLSRDHVEALSAIVRNMREFAVSGVRIDEQCLAELADQPHLESITLQRTNLSGEGLKAIVRIRSIRNLYLVDTNVRDEDLIVLKSLPNLHALYLGGNQKTTKGGIEHLRKMLIDCKITAE